MGPHEVCLGNWIKNLCRARICAQETKVWRHVNQSCSAFWSSQFFSGWKSARNALAMITNWHSWLPKYFLTRSFSQSIINIKSRKIKKRKNYRVRNTSSNFILNNLYRYTFFALDKCINQYRLVVNTKNPSIRSNNYTVQWGIPCSHKIRSALAQ